MELGMTLSGPKQWLNIRTVNWGSLCGRTLSLCVRLKRDAEILEISVRELHMTTDSLAPLCVCMCVSVCECDKLKRGESAWLQVFSVYECVMSPGRMLPLWAHTVVPFTSGSAAFAHAHTHTHWDLWACM